MSEELTGPVNVVQITITHRASTNAIAITATSPYIEDPHDAVIINLRNLLVKYVAEITEPQKPGESHPVWGEWVEDKPEQAPEAIRTPSAIVTEF